MASIMDGCNAREGDIVRNLTTGRTGRMTYGTQSGRIVVEVSVGPVQGSEQVRLAHQTWERWNTVIIEINRDHWSRRI